MMVCASKTTTFNPGGFDLERIEDGIMHQELRDSMTCGICLGKYKNKQFNIYFRNPLRSYGVRQLQETFLPKVHLSVEKKLPLLVPWYFESSSEQPCPIRIPPNHKSSVSHM